MAGVKGSRCSCTALRKASRRISQLYEIAMEPSGLKITQRAILAQINRTEPVRVGDLAEALVIDAGALAHNLKPLERDGLVAINIDPADRRNRKVSLTKAGLSRLTGSDAQWEKAQQSFEKALGPKQCRVLLNAMNILISDEFSKTFAQSLLTN
jgi:DNA-binding MarR family transcriptional regulator